MSTNSQYSTADFLQCVIARHYEKEHGASVVSIGLAPKWDIRFNDGITLEIKCDTAAARTGNAAIEFWNAHREKPSGILETEAQYWLHCIPESDALRCFMLQTKRLLKLCIECGMVQTGGDFDASVMKLIPVDDIRRISDSEFLLEGLLWKQ
jgi:hypothetical protein